MPPKVISLGAKKGPPQAISLGLGPKPVIPSALAPDAAKVEFITDRELQSTISNKVKDKLIAKAKTEEGKLPRYVIEKIEFSILNSNVLDKLKVVNVSNRINRDMPLTVDLVKRDQYSSQKNLYPGTCYETEDKRMGANEILNPDQSITSYIEMGTMDNNKPCSTCYKTNMDCPGHIGEIKLNQRFAHPLFYEYIIKVLSCVCNSCSGILVREELLKQQGIIPGTQGKARLNAIFEIAKEDKIICKNKGKNCGIKLFYKSKRQLQDGYLVEYTTRPGEKTTLPQNINDTYRILNGISDKDAQLLGFRNGSHPRDMIMDSFPVIPPCARPYTVREGQIKEDHLTTAYDEIIRDNYKLYAVTDERRREAVEKDLYFHLSHFIDNSDKKYCKSPTESIHGIKQRITQKDGLIRSNIMGKRVDMCGRSVLGPCSELKFGEVAIPEEMCNTLTVPEKVHEKNLEYIKKLWYDREVVAYYFDYDSLLKGRRYRVNDASYNQIYNGKKLEPHIGFVVERKLRDGDVVLVNRQPTLYKFGMVGNFVKKVPRKTIGIHMTETKMRNADFDGDEANIHVMQALDARVEAMTIANTQSCIPNSLRNSAMIGMFYNSLSGAYIMTRSPVTDANIISRFNEFPKQEVQMMMSPVMLTEAQIREAHSKLSYKGDLFTLPKRLAKHNINPLSGHALFSCILPQDFQYFKAGKNKNNVVIKDGVLVSGRIDANHIGNKGNTIQMAIWKWYGKERAVAFVTDCVFITDWFIYQYGFSIGFDDINPTGDILEQTRKYKNKEIAELKIKLENLGKITPDMTPVAKEKHEKDTLTYLGGSKSEINKLGALMLSPENSLNIMSNSGAKGKPENTANIFGTKGQEIVQDSRPLKKISGGTRCLPYFDYNSDNIKARGFISHSFLEGMTPSEMYFLAEGARVGGISIATTTAESGSVSHKLVKVFEDYKIAYDGSVRNANDMIFQFGYLDGYDCGELVNTRSNSTGEVISFINVKDAVDRINAEFK